MLWKDLRDLRLPNIKDIYGQASNSLFWAIQIVFPYIDVAQENACDINHNRAHWWHNLVSGTLDKGLFYISYCYLPAGCCSIELIPELIPPF